MLLTTDTLLEKLNKLEEEVRVLKIENEKKDSKINSLEEKINLQEEETLEKIKELEFNLIEEINDSVYKLSKELGQTRLETIEHIENNLDCSIMKIDENLTEKIENLKEEHREMIDFLYSYTQTGQRYTNLSKEELEKRFQLGDLEYGTFHFMNIGHMIENPKILEFVRETNDKIKRRLNKGFSEIEKKRNERNPRYKIN